METVNEVKEALSARSRTATLDELRNEGRRKVRLIRAEHVAAMISEAVHSAIEMSGLIPKDEADRLVESSRQEFRNILKEREAEVLRAQEVEEQLHERERELREAQAELAAAREAIAALESRPTAAPGVVGAAPAAAGAMPGASPEMLYMLMNELANLKASMAQPSPAQAPAAAAAPDLSAALEKLTGTLNDRLEQFGRKMGISSAVEGGEVSFDGLFKDTGKQLESNMENIQVKQKAGGGIAANLAKLKKLKGGNS